MPKYPSVVWYATAALPESKIFMLDHELFVSIWCYGLEIQSRHEVVSLLIFTPLPSGVRFSREISIRRCWGKR